MDMTEALVLGGEGCGCAFHDQGVVLEISFFFLFGFVLCISMFKIFYDLKSFMCICCNQVYCIFRNVIDQ